MGRKHLAVGIDVDALALGLLQQLFQVVKIVAGDHDEWSLFHLEGHADGNRVAEGLSVGLVQHLHALEIDLADLQDDRQQQVHAPVLADGKERLCQECVDLPARMTEDARVIGVGRHAADTEEDQGLQGTDVLVRVPELLHVVVVVPSAGRSAAGAIRNQPLLLRVHLVDQRAEGLFVKADIGDGGEQSLDEELVGALRRMGVAVRGAGKADQRAGQFILQRCNVRSFPADAGFPLAAGAACGLFTLEAKHFVFRVGHLLKLLLWRSPGSCHTPPMRPHGTLPVLLRRLQRQRPRRSSKRPPDRFPRTDRSRCSRHLLHTSRVSSSFT